LAGVVLGSRRSLTRRRSLARRRSLISGRSLATLVLGGGLLRRSSVVSTGRGPVANDGEVGTDGDGLVLLGEDLLEGAGHRRGDLRVDLVGRDLEQRCVDGDLVTDSLEPPGDGALGHGLAEGGHGHTFGHGVSSPYRRWRASTLVVSMQGFAGKRQ